MNHHISKNKEKNRGVPEHYQDLPQAKLIHSFNASFLNNDTTLLFDIVSDDFVWHLIGHRSIVGKIDNAEFIRFIHISPMKSLEVYHMIIDGYQGCCEGTFSYENGVHYRFCDVYQFQEIGQSLKIKELTSYVIQIDSSS